MVSRAEPTAPSAGWSRTYPPLALLAFAVLVSAFVLPSALNLPQTNPSTVLEYAPVPPEDDQPDTPPGNVSSLGLGSSGTLGIGGQPSPPPPPRVAVGQRGKTTRALAKRCVGDPPKQTEDPMSPPCVGYFEGDNFGATWQGVTEAEVKVLILLDYGCPNYECAPAPNTYRDLDTEPLPPCPKTFPAGNPDSKYCDYIWIRVARGLNTYFNERFQTYGRHVHYYTYNTGASNSASRRADAAENYKTHKPFAVIDYGTYGGANQAYDDAMAVRAVSVISSRGVLTNAVYSKNAPNMWGFWPDAEHFAPLYASYVCQKVAPFLVSHYGNPPGAGPPNGQKREFGLFYTTDVEEHGLIRFRELVKQELRRCGVDWKDREGSFDDSGFIVSGNPQTGSADAVAKFQAERVTTVLYLGGTEGKFSQYAAQSKYYPEIVVAGDLEIDNNQAGRLQNQEVWQNAWGTHLQMRIDRPEDAIGYRAMKEGRPQTTLEEARFANEMYRDHFMLFQAIQVAGPDLNPEAVDKGFHAIPHALKSQSPYNASFFFDPGDYSGVKDATEWWWDVEGISPDGGQPGCLRLVRGGQRYQARQWEGGDEVFRDTQRDPCSGWESRYQLRL